MMNRICSSLVICGLVLATSACQAQPAASDSDVPAQVVRIGEMPGPRAAHQATRLPSGKVLVTGVLIAGGMRVRRGEVLRSAEIFDPATGASRRLATWASRARSMRRCSSPMDGC